MNVLYRKIGKTRIKLPIGGNFTKNRKDMVKKTRVVA